MEHKLELGQNIRKYRIMRGLTQEKLAEYSDLSVNFISKMERMEKQNISIDKLSSIAEVLKVTIADLISLTEPKQPKYGPNMQLLIKQLEQLDTDKAERYSQIFVRILDEADC
ncbi:helix-turn-helix domain-containing protein [Streptococcus himalayensis]|uniref:HTH cro/C1-type domain-containing protein n=1 Tax=Streptococcus himalayensis TaxID=1888195 RepID=A0A917A8K6_9STRE|nr:helix-turn-helix transcriptional regulator [Streptococcus himalayensis]GGE32953.1 hypothetical protein GCM10011510_12880 [Streptococcus himalayensis]